MKRLSLFAGMMMIVPALAMAQAVPPVPPMPPTAPAPPAPPSPMVAPLPPLSPMIDMNQVQEAIAAGQAVRVDNEALRAVSAAARADAEAMRQASRVDTDTVREQARASAELARQELRGDAWSTLENFNFAPFQDGFQNTIAVSPSADSGAYASGLSAIDQKQYDRAVTQFDRAISQKGTHTDGAYYWKAFAEYKLGKSDEALATLAELKRANDKSRYLDDAKLLEADVKRASGQPVTSDNAELKLLAIQGLSRSDPNAAATAAEGILNSTNTLQMKKNALYVLALSDSPQAHQMLLSYAKGKGNPDLQSLAITYLMSGRNHSSTAELKDIYDSTQDTAVKSAIIRAYVSAGDKNSLFTIAGGNGPIEIRKSALNGLTSIATPQDLWQLYAKEENKDLRIQMVRGFGSMGALEQLQQVLKTEKDPAVKQQAIRSLGSMKSEKTGAMLIEMYSNDQDADTRKAIISALGAQNNAEGLIACARKETNNDVKVEIVRRIVDLSSRSQAAKDYLLEIIKK